MLGTATALDSWFSLILNNDIEFYHRLNKALGKYTWHVGCCETSKKSMRLW